MPSVRTPSKMSWDEFILAKHFADSDHDHPQKRHGNWARGGGGGAKGSKAPSGGAKSPPAASQGAQGGTDGTQAESTDGDRWSRAVGHKERVATTFNPNLDRDRVMQRTQGVDSGGASLDDTPGLDHYLSNGYIGANGLLHDYDSLEDAARDTLDYKPGVSGLNPRSYGWSSRLIESMDWLMERSKTTEPAVVYRGSELPDGVFLDKLKVGDIIRDKGFVSTSLDYAVADKFRRSSKLGLQGKEKRMLKIRVPAGMRALDVDTFEKAGLVDSRKREFELILNRGTSYRVVSLGEGGDWDLELEVVSDGG